MKRRTKIVLPLVNAHTHAAMVAFRGLGEDKSLDQWLEKYIWPAEAEQVDRKFVYKNTKLAIREMETNGIRAFNDMYFFAETVAKAAKELGMAAMVGEPVLDFPTPSAKSPEEALALTEELIIRYKNDPLIKVAVAPHSIYALSKENLIKCKKLADRYKVPVHIHLSETEKEMKECKKKYRTTPVEFLDSLHMLDERAVLVHCVWLTDCDIDIIAKRKCTVVHCPLSNLKLGSGIAPIIKLMDRKVNVAFGTDGAASSNRLDVWEAGKVAALLQKGISRKADAAKAKDIMEMMSLNGMKALGIKNIQGRNMDDVKKTLSKNNHSLLYHLNPQEIDFVI